MCPRFFFLVVAVASVVARSALGQSGDKQGEIQSEVVASHLIPTAPVLSPEDQIKSFRLPLGFTAELVAAEPLIKSPVAIQFDHQGRLWVVEMSGYMRSSDGAGEPEPLGAVVILSDLNGDGQMDRRTVFADKLVMPRAVMLTHGGALIAEPPRLWFMRDTDGDGRADEKLLVSSDYANQNNPSLGAKSNPEHASNGLLLALDNWIYSANHTTRYRHGGGSPTNWVAEETAFRGQWGITQDDEGRLFYNSNSDQIRADLLPGNALARNPNLRQPFGLNFQLAASQKVWPSRVNPGVNRGYQPKTLAANGRLDQFTAACGPLVYRGDQFPKDYQGDVFLCEPSANLIRRNHIRTSDGVLQATNAYPESEFLTSTDERFRPVSLQNGPDGALYIVDMARGLIQHRIYLTSYLRKQIESRQLQGPLDLGRIYRIVHAGKKPERTKAWSERPSLADKLSRLSDSNGFWRDTAQRLLIQSPEPDTEKALSGLLISATTSALGRVQALWTLEGMRALRPELLASALTDPDPRVQRAALRVLSASASGPQRESFLKIFYSNVGRLSTESHSQLLLTLGDLPAAQAEPVMQSLLLNYPGSKLRFDSAVSGLRGREFTFLQRLLTDPANPIGGDDHLPLFSRLAQCVMISGNADAISSTLALAANRPPNDRRMVAILDGFALTAVPVKVAGSPKQKTLMLPSEPAGLKALRTRIEPEVVSRFKKVESLFSWAGKPGMELEIQTPVRAINAEFAASIERGREVYPTLCGACHQPHGRGQEGLAPPLVDSEWALGSDQRLIRIVLHGVRDALTVKGVRYELNMPALAEALDDRQIADVLTYIRREWDHTGEPVNIELVRNIRQSESKREDSWTEAELLKLR